MKEVLQKELDFISNDVIHEFGSVDGDQELMLYPFCEKLTTLLKSTLRSGEFVSPLGRTVTAFELFAKSFTEKLEFGTNTD
jgi:hypothetical protein